MVIAPLTLAHCGEWAALLATCFDRTPEQMEQLLVWLHQLSDIAAWGVWDDGKLVAQYTCMIRSVATNDAALLAGMSINMAVHPLYRGRGLVKKVAEPAYDQVRERGGVMGLGFSNAQGVRVDRQSKGYGYQVVGQMQPLIGILPRARVNAITLQDTFPSMDFSTGMEESNRWHFKKTPEYLHTRYASHPFRQYRYGVWIEEGCVLGIVVYRPITMFNIQGVALLDAYGVNISDLLTCWGGTVRANGAAFVHVLATPQSIYRQPLQKTLSIPYARTPYFLTAKPLTNDFSAAGFRMDSWDFVGGDIL